MLKTLLAMKDVFKFVGLDESQMANERAWQDHLPIWSSAYTVKEKWTFHASHGRSRTQENLAYQPSLRLAQASSLVRQSKGFQKHHQFPRRERDSAAGDVIHSSQEDQTQLCDLASG